MTYVDIHMDGKREPFRIQVTKEEAQKIENEMARKGILGIKNTFNTIFDSEVIINFEYVKYIEVYEVESND